MARYAGPVCKLCRREGTKLFLKGTRCLTEKLMTYALGRELEIGDRPAVDRICEEMVGTKKGLRDLIQAIVASESFSRN